MTWTREMVDGLAVGTVIVRDVMGVGRRSTAEIVEVFAKRDSISGRRFVCFYTRHGSNRLSGSIREGDDFTYFRPVECAP